MNDEIEVLKSTKTMIKEIKKELKIALATIIIIEQVIARIIEKKEAEE